MTMKCRFCPEEARFFIGWNRADGTKGWGWVCLDHEEKIALLNGLQKVCPFPEIAGQGIRFVGLSAG